MNLRIQNIFKPTAEMLESLKLPSLNPPSIPTTIPEEPATMNGLRNASENIPNDPFSSTNGGSRDRSDLAFNNHPSFFNRLNEGLGNGASELETPTAQSSNPAGHEMLGGGNLNTISEKPPPVRKTRAATTEITTRKLSSRSTREIGNDVKRPTTASSQDINAIAAPARRSTRLTSKFTSKLGVGSERETRLATKERERDAKKVKTTGSRSRSGLHLSSSGATAAVKERERDKGNSEDVNVRNGSSTTVTISFEITEPQPQRATRATTATIAKRKAMASSADPSLTRMRKKQMTDAVAVVSKPPTQVGPSKPLIDLKKEEAMYFVLKLFEKLGVGYFSLCRFHCKEALQAFNSLPASQRETPWVQTKIGRAHYEMANYADVRPFSPWRRVTSNATDFAYRPRKVSLKSAN